MTENLLNVRDLRLDIVSGRVSHNVVDNVSFSIGRGEAYGLVGESGCGKSITALSIIGLLRAPLAVTGGSLKFNGRDLRELSKRELRRLRGDRIAIYRKSVV